MLLSLSCVTVTGSGDRTGGREAEGTRGRAGCAAGRVPARQGAGRGAQLLRTYHVFVPRVCTMC